MTSKLLVLGAIFFSIVGCNSSDNNGASGNQNNSTSAALFPGMAVTTASSEQCPAGGKIYVLYVDANMNGIEDVNETPLSQQIVCNGINGAQGVQGQAGADGYNALITTSRVQTDACPAGHGLQVSYGLDVDRSTILDASEVQNTSLLCDGTNGEVGATGAAGANGHSVVFASVSASSQVCPAGGVTTLMALDINDIGVYSALDPNQSSMTICNGQNGQDGTNGTNGTNGTDAALTPYTPVDAITPCGSNVFAKEVLLRMYNGQVLASFSDNANGKNTRFAFLADGSYVDTDDSNCTFSLSTSGTTRSISWGGHVQETWTMQ